MGRASKPAITAQMYRHFATATVALTALIALFAHGENQPAAAQAAAPVARPEARPTQLEAPADSSDDDVGSWGDDGGDFGRPTTILPSSTAAWAAGPALAAEDREGDKADAGAQPTAEQVAAALSASHLRSGSAGRD